MPNFNKNNQLFTLIDYNDIVNIQRFIKQYKKVNINKNFNNEISYNYTPLHYAVLKNKYDIVKILIYEGADPTIKILKDTYNPEGILALELADNYGKKNISYILKPYTEKYFLLNDYYNSILHSKIIKHKSPNIIYNTIYNTIYNILLTINKSNVEYLPTEIIFIILDFCQLKDLKYQYKLYGN